MHKIVLLIILLSGQLLAMAQSPQATKPMRTPEDEAHKMTEMLVRELSLTDSAQQDTLYKMHLKFARRRRLMKQNSHLSDSNHMQALFQELRGILNEEQYQRFMTHLRSREPRHPQQVPFGGRGSAEPQPTEQPSSEQ